jgi:hypothetical protein
MTITTSLFFIRGVNRAVENNLTMIDGGYINLIPVNHGVTLQDLRRLFKDLPVTRQRFGTNPKVVLDPLNTQRVLGILFGHLFCF